MFIFKLFKFGFLFVKFFIYYLLNPPKELTEDSSDTIVNDTLQSDMTDTEQIIANIRDWSIDRIQEDEVSSSNARAIYAEFYEWIECSEQDSIDILSLEKKA